MSDYYLLCHECKTFQHLSGWPAGYDHPERHAPLMNETQRQVVELFLSEHRGRMCRISVQNEPTSAIRSEEYGFMDEGLWEKARVIVSKTEGSA